MDPDLAASGFARAAKKLLDFIYSGHAPTL
jgi:hypothetical protein